LNCERSFRTKKRSERAKIFWLPLQKKGNYPASNTTPAKTAVMVFECPLDKAAANITPPKIGVMLFAAPPEKRRTSQAFPQNISAYG